VREGRNVCGDVAARNFQRSTFNFQRQTIELCFVPFPFDNPPTFRHRSPVMRTIGSFSLYRLMSWRRLAAGMIARNHYVVVNTNPKRVCAGQQEEKT